MPPTVKPKPDRTKRLAKLSDHINTPGAGRTRKRISPTERRSNFASQRPSVTGRRDRNRRMESLDHAMKPKSNRPTLTSIT